MHIITRTGHELDVTALLREGAFCCALAYLAAFTIAICDHVERAS